MPDTQKTGDTAKKPHDRIADRFEAIAADLRVRARLAGEEAKDAWDRAHLDRVTDEIKRAREDAKVQLHLANLDAKDAFREAEKRMDGMRNAAGIGIDHVTEDLTKQIHRFATALRGGATGAKPTDKPAAPKG